MTTIQGLLRTCNKLLIIAAGNCDTHVTVVSLGRVPRRGIARDNHARRAHRLTNRIIKITLKERSCSRALHTDSAVISNELAELTLPDISRIYKIVSVAVITDTTNETIKREFFFFQSITRRRCIIPVSRIGIPSGWQERSKKLEKESSDDAYYRDRGELTVCFLIAPNYSQLPGVIK